MANSVTIIARSGSIVYHVPDWIGYLRDGIYGFYRKGLFFAFMISLDSGDGDRVKQVAMVSSDNGATWFGPLDAANAPVVIGNTAFVDQRSNVDFTFDGELFPGAVSHVTVMAGIEQDIATGDTIYSLFDFNLDTQTWGAAYNTWHDNVSLSLDIGYCSQLDSSTPVIFYTHGGSSPFTGTSTINGAATVAGQANPGTNNLVVDPDGNAFAIASSPSLGVFVPPDAGLPLTGNLRIIGKNIAIPSGPGGALAVYYRPLSGGSWVADTTPATIFSFGILMQPWLLEDCCGNVVVFYAGSDGSSIFVTSKAGGFSAAPPGSGWSAPAMVYSVATDSNPDAVGATIWFARANRNPKLGGIDFVMELASPFGTFSSVVTFHVPGSLCASCDLADGTVGAAYSQFLLACVGANSPTFSITAGALPDGLSLDPATGVISGTPTTGGTFNFTFTASGGGSPVVQPCSITIAGGSLTISCGSPPAASVGQPYSYTIPHSGGTPPYAFSITAGSLPTGLTINATTGAITGTPTTIGDFPFTVQVRDSIPNTASANCSITVSSTLSISCNNPGNGIIGTSYSQTFLVTNGTPPYTFLILSGTTPTGLTLNTSTGVLSGNPSVAGDFTFVIQVTDAATATANVTCTDTIVGGPLAVNCGSPPNGNVGVTYTYTFPKSGGLPPYVFSVTSGTLPPGLVLDPATGIVSGVPTTAGTYNFTIGIKGSL